MKPGTDESSLAIGLESLQATNSGQRAADIAGKLLLDARLEAIETDTGQWDCWSPSKQPTQAEAKQAANETSETKYNSARKAFLRKLPPHIQTAYHHED
jgi:hypothetical protein